MAVRLDPYHVTVMVSKMNSNLFGLFRRQTARQISDSERTCRVNR